MGADDAGGKASTASAHTLQNRRRAQRQKEAMYHVLQALPPPFGVAADVSYRPLLHLAPGLQSGSIIDWGTMPAACDPCALLDNIENTTRKKGMAIDTQISHLQFDRSSTSQAAQAVAATNARGDSRGMQKRWQVESFAAALSRLLPAGPDASGTQPLHVVDFGCGTGGLLLPLAHMYPWVHFTGVEMKPAAVKILSQRAAAAGLTNVTTFLGMIEAYKEPFDVALALHACGNATDHTLLHAQQLRAAFAVSPCCVGKLKFSLLGGSSFSAHVKQYHSVAAPDPDPQPAQLPTSAPDTAAPPSSRPQHSTAAIVAPPAITQGVETGRASSSQPTQEQSAGTADTSRDQQVVVHHPRSRALAQALPEPEKQFRLMASIADTNAPDVQRKAQAANPPAQAMPPQQPGPGTGAPDVPADQQSPAGSGRTGAMAEAAEDPSTTSSGSEPSNLEIARCCKLHVELDRCMAAVEDGYAAALFRLLNSGSMAKGDLLVGVPRERAEWQDIAVCLQA